MATTEQLNVGVSPAPAPIPSERSEDEKEAKVSSTKRMFVIFGKTWSDCFRPKKVIILLIFMVLVPLMTSIMPTPFGPSVDYNSVSAYSAAMNMSFTILPYLYMWTLGVILCAAMGAQAAGMIADEVDKHTMLILISKPVGRIQIFFGKFLAVYLFGIIMSFLGVFTVSWIIVLMKSANFAHFLEMIPFIELMTLYSLFVVAIFVSIAMALSSIMATGKKVSMIVLLLVILTFLGFFVIRMVLGDAYKTYFLYYVDIGYHMGNVLVLFNELTGIIPPSATWQVMFNMFAGVYDAPSLFGSGGASLVDPSQNINLGSYPLIGYLPPIISFLIWVGLALLLVGFGLIKLKTKEISS